MHIGEKSNTVQPMLSANTRMLVSIATAISLNCKPCLEALIPAALKHGILPEEISEVFSTVTEVEADVSTFTEDLVGRLLGRETDQGSKQTCCSGDECSK
jgi:AhpD family alkylhydroperoxidase